MDLQARRLAAWEVARARAGRAAQAPAPEAQAARAAREATAGRAASVATAARVRAAARLRAGLAALRRETAERLATIRARAASGAKQERQEPTEEPVA